MGSGQWAVGRRQWAEGEGRKQWAEDSGRRAEVQVPAARLLFSAVRLRLTALRVLVFCERAKPRSG